jgi:hypothetical protein
MKALPFATSALITTALITTVSAASIPAGWTIIKDSKGACQAGIPPDFKPNPSFKGLGEGPGQVISIQIVSQAGAKVRPLNDLAQKAVRVDKMFDNTNDKLFYSTAPLKGFDGKTSTGWHITVTGNGGTCSGIITLLPGASEDLAKKIADTLGPAK